MRFLKLNKSKIEANLSQCSYNELKEFARFIDDISGTKVDFKKVHSMRKTLLIEKLSTVLFISPFVEKIYAKLSLTKASKFVYENLIWENDSLNTKDIMTKFNIDFLSDGSSWGDNCTNQKDEFLFVQRIENHYANDLNDRLCLRDNFKFILKMVFPVSDEVELLVLDNTKYFENLPIYSNEEHILHFINIISEMLKNDLVEFGKSNEKPLNKTLNILKNSTQIEEFYNDKKLSLIATDMLTRSFFYYYKETKKFELQEIDTLKNFLKIQFEDKLDYFITRTFLPHLKKVRYDKWYTKQTSLFEALKLIISNMQKDSWVTMDNIVKFCKYRDIRIDLDQAYKTNDYYMDCDIAINGGLSQERIYIDNFNYNILFLEPILKASFFYLGALGLFELHYDEPYSSYTVSEKGKSYISPFDSIEFIKLSKLGEYIFGLSDTYDQKTIIKKETTLKFDEYKPIISIDSQDTLSFVKLEPYCDKYDTNKYILSYVKIFKDCKNTKALELKIDNFYKNIEPNPPKVFKNFFDQIKQNTNALQRELKQVVIKLDKNEKLLELFKQNKKLQELIVKAQGYRVIVLKENISKLTKIVKENGFFIEF